MNYLKLILSVFILGLFLLTSCENSLTDDLSPNEVAETLTNSNGWQITYFWDKTKEETSEFNGYVFQFKESGVFEAIKGGKVTTGSWKISNSGKKLIIDIGQLDPLEELTDDWIILEQTKQLIKLKDDNDEHLEEIHFKVF